MQQFPGLSAKQTLFLALLIIMAVTSEYTPIRVSRRCLSQQVGELLRVKVKQLPVSGQGDRASQFEWRLEEDTERPEHSAIGEGSAF